MTEPCTPCPYPKVCGPDYCRRDHYRMTAGSHMVCEAADTAVTFDGHGTGESS